jgi:hypothetical protein
MEGEKKQIKISSSMLGSTNKQPKQSRHRKRNPRANVALDQRISSDTIDTVIPDEFDSSIDYLRSLTPSINEKEKISDDLTNTISHTNTDKPSPLVLSSEPFPSTVGPPTEDTSITTVEVVPTVSKDSSETVSQLEPPTIKLSSPIRKDPPYGILRNGVKQTYRSWKRSNSTDSPNHGDISGGNKSEKIPPKHKHKTLRRYPIGINGRKISILMKNLSLKKNVDKEIQLIKKHSIAVVKRTLKKNNIIKSGSTAPVDMLRSLYENCTLAGKIVNKSPDVLIHNFMNENKN